MNVGVPQGSILSPTLFNLYLAPLASLAEQNGAKIISYADDTQLLFTCEKGSEFDGHAINACLSEVFSWLNDNQMTCNPHKSEIIFFGHRPCETWNSWWPQNLSPPSSSVTTVKNLGVSLDATLSMKSQIQSVAGTCFGILRMVRNFLPLLSVPHRKTIVQALVTSRLDYANSLYLGLPSYLIACLQVIQNTAARAIFLAAPRTHASPLLSALHWLPVHERIQFKALTLVFKAFNQIGAPYLGLRFPRYIPQRTLRSSTLLLTPVPKVSLARIGGRSFQAIASRLWNSLPLDLKQAQDLLTFRKKLKTCFFQI